MKIFNFKVVYRYRGLKNLMLNLFEDNILAIDSNKYIACSEVNS